MMTFRFIAVQKGYQTEITFPDVDASMLNEEGMAKLQEIGRKNLLEQFEKWEAMGNDSEPVIVVVLVPDADSNPERN